MVVTRLKSLLKKVLGGHASKVLLTGKGMAELEAQDEDEGQRT